MILHRADMLGVVANRKQSAMDFGMSSMPKPSSRRANAINPVLSDTEMRARKIGRRCSTIVGPPDAEGAGYPEI
jgi:hypothetical protein